MPVRHRTLTANAVTTVTFDQKYDEFEVVNVSGTAEVYFRFDAVDPTVAGDDCEVLPASIGGQQVTVYGDPIRETTTVRLISAGTPRVAVRAW